MRKGAEFKNYSLKNWLHALGLGFLGTYLYYILLYFAYANASGLEVLVLQYSWPIFLVIFSVILLKEKLNTGKTVAVLLGSLGVLLVLTKGNFKDLHFENYQIDGLVILAATVFALFSALSKKMNLEAYTLHTIYFSSATIAAFLSMLYFSQFMWPTLDAVLPVLINGLLVNGFSYLFYFQALKLSPASFVAPFVFLTPVLSAIYLILFFQEPFLPVYMLGLLAVVAGGLVNRS